MTPIITISLPHSLLISSSSHQVAIGLLPSILSSYYPHQVAMDPYNRSVSLKITISLKLSCRASFLAQSGSLKEGPEDMQLEPPAIVKPRMLWSGKQVCGAYYAPTCKACLRVCICAGATQSVNVKPRTLWSGKQVCGAYCAPTCKACLRVCMCWCNSICHYQAPHVVEWQAGTRPRARPACSLYVLV